MAAVPTVQRMPVKEDPNLVVGIKNFNKDFRKTKAGVELGRALFDPSYKNYVWGSQFQILKSPAIISQLLRMSGIQVPKEVQVSASVAQLIMAGGSLISNLDKGMSIGQSVNPIALTMNAAVDLMSITGMIEKNTPQAIVLNIAADMAMVISSGGLNVLADIKLVFDSYALVQMEQQMAMMDAYKGLNTWIKDRRISQRSALVENFKAYQQKELGIFGLMGKMAEESPDMFYNYFPDAQMFIPPQWITSVCASASYEGMTSGHMEHKACIAMNIKTVMNTNHTYIQSKILENFVTKPMAPFLRLKNDHERLNKISVQAMGILSMLPPYFDMYHQNMDFLPMLKTLDLTPGDLGGNIIHNLYAEKIIQPSTPVLYPKVGPFGQTIYSEKPWYKNQCPVGSREAFGGCYSAALNRVVAHGELVVSTPQAAKAKKYDAQGEMKKLMLMSGNKSALEYWAKPEWTPDPTFVKKGTYQKAISPEMATHQQRSIRNYWSALATLQKMRVEKYFNDQADFLNQYDWAGDIDGFESLHRDVMYKVTSRYMNKTAKKYIALYLGTTVDNIKMVPGELGEPAKYVRIK